MLLVVGLGNPGPKYKATRHNAGFMAVDRLASRAGAFDWREKFGGLATRAVVAGKEAWLLKPETFMNLSGRAVQKAFAALGLTLADLIVVHDEIELAPGDVRLKFGGGHGGHNGLRDISAALGPDYARVRVGVGRPTVGTVEAYVLDAFRSEELPLMDKALETAADGVERFVADGPSAATPKPGPRPRKPG